MPNPLRIAILTDIHGNTIALDTVLQNIRQAGEPDEYWILGDLVALGPDPLGVLERLAGLTRARFIRGNTDRYVVSGGHPDPLPETANLDPAYLRRYIGVSQSMAWTAGAVASAGWLPFMEDLPLEFRYTLPDGKRVLACHASPGMDDGKGIDLLTSDEELLHLVAGAEADLVLVGHTHAAFDRQAGGVRVVNPGSLSNPPPPDLRAKYLMLTAGDSGYSLEFCQVDYDRQAVIEAMQRVRQPSLPYITRLMRGEK